MPDATALTPGQTVVGVVTALDPRGASLEVDGIVAYAHVSRLAHGDVADPADVVRVGQRVEATVGPIGKRGTPMLDLRSRQGDPWYAFSEAVRPGNLVRTRVARTGLGGVVLVPLPGVSAFVPAGALAGARPRHGSTVVAQVVALDPRQRRLRLDPAAGAAGAAVPVPLRVYADGPVFAAPDDPDAERAPAPQPVPATPARGTPPARARPRPLRTVPSVRAAPDARRSAEALDEAIGVAYARLYRGGDQDRYPRHEVRVGPRFLDSFRRLRGIDGGRVFDVLAHVAAGRAPEIRSLDVRPLHAGPGAPQAKRADGARGWRLSLEQHTPAARRLHFWTLIGDDGRRVFELDVVGTHDEHV